MASQPDQVLGEFLLSELDHIANALHAAPAHRSESFEVDIEIADAVLRARQAGEATRVLLATEPLVATCRVASNRGEKVLLVSRVSIPDHLPLHGDALYVSYLSPLGRAISLAVGMQDSILVPDGEWRLTVKETDHFRPIRDGSAPWDARDNRIARIGDSPRTIESFRAFLTQSVPAAVADAALLERAALARVPVPSRTVRDRLALQDQPLLDEVQDPIFRLPVNARIIVTGAPGTGKTTLMIKRISQKSRREFLDSSEIEGLTQTQLTNLLDPRRTWVLFTSTELLRDYLKEAFAKEGLPATSATVRTWGDQRMQLARDVFRFVRVGGRGRFKHTKSTLLNPVGGVGSIDYENSFRAYVSKARVTVPPSIKVGLQARLQLMEGRSYVLAGYSNRELLDRIWSLNRELIALYRRLLSAIDSGGRSDPSTLGRQFADERRQLQNRVNDLLEQSLVELARLDPALVKRQGGLSTQAAAYLREVLQGAAEGGKEEDLQPYLDCEPSLKGVLELFWAWLWCAEQVEIEADHLDARVRRFASRYREFRSQGLKDGSLGSLFTGEAKERLKSEDSLLDDCEADLLLYIALEEVHRELERQPALQWSESATGVLGRLLPHIRTFVAVDEAPDFSAWQLGSMLGLSHPHWGAFSVAGDLMQRATTYGIRSWADCDRFAHLEVHTLRRVYRQSRRLLSIAALMYERSLSEPAPFESAFPKEPEPAPLLLREKNQQKKLAWVAKRIVEVYEQVGRLPSIAVFVPQNDMVKPIAKALDSELEGQAIEVEACVDGKVLGTGERVRVFSLEFIKGLEFHAAFLLDFDDVFEGNGDLGEKYLYLGLTRPTLFLGVTVNRSFPKALAYLEGEFEEGDWALG